MFQSNLSAYDKDILESAAKDHFEQYTPLIAWIIIQSVQKDMSTTGVAVQYQVDKAFRNLCFHRFEFYVHTGVYN
ncbi:hypothetical protein MAR_030962 [Mya arenaria]|uniref:Uncharacterized protein n=1 Tax=Mya arenaria TaxID=6604 RepID=A0ABY7F2F3_MYAAR|nr:hypothetical protein MAR_030962 [Mya arenaria]